VSRRRHSFLPFLFRRLVGEGESRLDLSFFFISHRSDGGGVIASLPFFFSLSLLRGHIGPDVESRSDLYGELLFSPPPPFWGEGIERIGSDPGDFRARGSSSQCRMLAATLNTAGRWLPPPPPLEGSGFLAGRRGRKGGTNPSPFSPFFSGER